MPIDMLMFILLASIDGADYGGEALGNDYTAASERADHLNLHLDAWRRGRTSIKTLDQGPRPEYIRALERIEDLPVTTGGTVAELPVASITPAAADNVYAKLLIGPRGRRIRQANMSIDVARRAWDVVHRTHPSTVPVENPIPRCAARDVHQDEAGCYAG